MIYTKFSDSTYKKEDTHTRGYAFCNDQFFEGEGLTELLNSCENMENWKELVKNLNGYFCAVTKFGTKVVAAVDRLRSIPLFYGQSGKDIYVSDDAYWIQEKLNTYDIPEVPADEFALTGYVTGSDTLVQGIRQLRGGELAEFDSAGQGKIDCSRYYSFRHDKFSPLDTQSLLSKLDSVHQNIFKRLVTSVQGRQIVLPLSGGYDSRLIGKSLRDLGVENVVCYNYGTDKNWETAISKELADYLGYKWIYIPYSNANWAKWGKLGEFKKYFRYSGNLTSVPHVQDWPAVRELQQKKVMDEDSVIVPGHTGDFIAGGHIPSWFAEKSFITRAQLINSIFQKHYNLWDWPKKTNTKDIFSKRIEAVIGKVNNCSPEEAADLFEYWEIQERQAKFICNSLRVYDFFQYKWRLPLYDHELMDYWSQISIDNRMGRKLYYEYCKQYQKLPITEANEDYGKLTRVAVKWIEDLKLKDIAYKVRRVKRKLFWKKEYYDPFFPPLGWYGLLDIDEFHKSYTGKETMHSFLSKRYLQMVKSANTTK